MSARADTIPKGLVAAILALALVVLGLGGAIVVLKLRPAAIPSAAIDRNVEEWKRAVLAAPTNDDARTGLGLALLDAGQMDEARDAFEEALKLNDRNWMALMQLGVLVADDDPTRALKLLAHAVENATTGNKALALIAQGDVLRSQGDLEGAGDAYASSIADIPYLIDAHIGLAKVLEALGDRKGALSEYRAAAIYNPEDPAIQNAISRLQGKG